MEQAFQPAHQLGLGDPQFGVARQVVLGERQRQPLELVDQLRREAVLELLDGALVDLLQPGPALLVQRSRPDLLEQLPDHVADPHDLGRLLDHLGDRALAAAALILVAGRGRYAVRAYHEDLRVFLRVHPVAHSPSLSDHAACPVRRGFIPGVTTECDHSSALGVEIARHLAYARRDA